MSALRGGSGDVVKPRPLRREQGPRKWTWWRTIEDGNGGTYLELDALLLSFIILFLSADSGHFTNEVGLRKSLTVLGGGVWVG